MPDNFTTREVAELAGVSIRAVDKAIEERILVGVRSVRGKRQMLPLHAVPYAAIVSKLSVTLSREAKRNLAKTLGDRAEDRMTSEPLDLEPSLTLDVSALVGGDLAERAARYGRAREDHIEENPDILGGTPVICGTRMSVYAVLGRLEGGDSVESIVEDNPHLSAEIVETAALYARTHPLLGRPGGRPWTKAA